MACAFVEAAPGRRLFGLAFTAQLLGATGDEECAEKLEKVTIKSLADGGNFEDQAYLLQTLWQLRVDGGRRPDETVMRFSEQLIERSPAWQYLMNGSEDIPPASMALAMLLK